MVSVHDTCFINECRASGEYNSTESDIAIKDYKVTLLGKILYTFVERVQVTVAGYLITVKCQSSLLCM